MGQRYQTAGAPPRLIAAALVFAVALLWSAGVTAPPPPAAAQTEPPPADVLPSPPSNPPQSDAPQLEFSDSVAVRWILVPAFVEPPASAGLPQTAFALWVNDRQVPIETFENRPEAAASVLILQDLSGSMQILRKLDHSRLVLGQLLDSAGGEDEFSLVTFRERRTEVVVPFTTDTNSVRQRAQAFAGEGTTGLYDAITWLPKLSLEGRRSRRAGVVLTDGVDNASLLDSEGCRQYVARTELPIYVVDLSELGSPADKGDDSRSAALRALCSGTGGRYHRPRSREELALVSDTIATELRNQYVLGFGADAAQPSAYQTLRVEVAYPGAVVRYRPTYFGPPPLQSAPPTSALPERAGVETSSRAAAERAAPAR